jgi:serine/threonine protein kinase
VRRLGGIQALKHEDASLFSPPGAFGPFRVMHQIGTGVVGPVFRTYDPESDRLVAVKAFDLDITPEQAEIFVEALKRIVDAGFSHSAIVVPLDAGLEDDIPFLATEYVTAESLDVAMHHVAPTSAREMVSFVGPLAAAVDAAHARGIMHGGLHCRDIFVEPDITRVNGFGVASALEHVGLKLSVRRPYTAPEIVAGRSWGPEADRFAVATIAYELLTGKRLAGSGDEVLARLVTTESVNIPDPSGLQQAFRNALADDPAIRPASAAGFVMALGDAIGFSSDEIVLAMSGVAQDSSSHRVNTQVPDSEDESVSVESEPLVFGTVNPEEPAADAMLHAEFSDSLDETFELTGSDEEDNLLEQEQGDRDPSLLNTNNVETVSTTRVVDSSEVDSGFAEDKWEQDVDEEPDKLVAKQVAEHDVMLPLELEADAESLKEEPEDLTRQAVFTDDSRCAPEDAEDSLSEIGERELPQTPSDTESEALDFEFENFNDGRDDPRKITEGVQVEDVVVAASGSSSSLAFSRPDIASNEIAGRGRSTFASDKSFSAKSSTFSLARIASTLFAIVTGVALAYMASVGLGTTTDDEPVIPASEPLELSSPPTDDFEPLSTDPVDAAIPLGSRSSSDVEDTTPVLSEATTELSPGTSSGTGSLEISTASADTGAAPSQSESTLSPAPLVQESNLSHGWLLVRTEPPGANVSIDGEDRGPTPLSLSEIPSGFYQIEISVPGFTTEQRTIEISPEETIAAISIELDPSSDSDAVLVAHGAVFVDSRPTGASVFLDGESVGVTPLIVQEVIVGIHEVRIIGDGYRSWLSTIQVEEGQRSRVTASLEPAGRR